MKDSPKDKAARKQAALQLLCRRCFQHKGVVS